MSTIKLKDTKPEPVAYSEAALRNNAAVVEYCRTSMAALSGSTAGKEETTIFYLVNKLNRFNFIVLKKIFY